MNRKRKLNELYKGVFKNDKKSCLVDLKPLNKKRELENDFKNAPHNLNDKALEKNIGKNKGLGVNLKVAKNAGFGSYFKKLHEDIVDIFIAKEDYISYEGLFNNSNLNELFNFKESTSKNMIEGQDVMPNNNQSKNSQFLNTNNPINFNIHRIENMKTENIKNENIQESDNPLSHNLEEILYEDDSETIYKRKKYKVSERKFNYYDIQNIKNSNLNLNMNLNSNAHGCFNNINNVNNNINQLRNNINPAYNIDNDTGCNTKYDFIENTSQSKGENIFINNDQQPSQYKIRNKYNFISTIREEDKLNNIISTRKPLSNINNFKS